MREHGRDRTAVALAMDAAMRRDIEPHYVSSCIQDADRTKLHVADRAGTEPDPAASAGRDFILHGLLPAARTDPDVFRKFFRSFNMLDRPDGCSPTRSCCSRPARRWRPRTTVHRSPPRPQPRRTPHPRHHRLGPVAGQVPEVTGEAPAEPVTGGHLTRDSQVPGSGDRR
ncbi:MAG: hypothetical protein R2697_10035 [Ilumatobacteraceae bacterium]